MTESASKIASFCKKNKIKHHLKYYQNETNNLFSSLIADIDLQYFL
jgi:hypothetical protein